LFRQDEGAFSSKSGCKKKILTDHGTQITVRMCKPELTALTTVIDKWNALTDIFLRPRCNKNPKVITDTGREMNHPPPNTT
jgi:hypothetical protein